MKLTFRRGPFFGGGGGVISEIDVLRGVTALRLLFIQYMAQEENKNSTKETSAFERNKTLFEQNIFRIKCLSNKRYSNKTSFGQNKPDFKTFKEMRQLKMFAKTADSYFSNFKST